MRLRRRLLPLLLTESKLLKIIHHNLTKDKFRGEGLGAIKKMSAEASQVMSRCDNRAPPRVVRKSFVSLRISRAQSYAAKPAGLSGECRVLPCDPRRIVLPPPFPAFHILLCAEFLAVAAFRMMGLLEASCSPATGVRGRVLPDLVFGWESRVFAIVGAG